MMRFIIAALAISSIFPQFCLAQTAQQLHTLPSSAEILELANKADEKVKVFEKALKASTPYLDKDTVQTDQAAADSAHTIITALRKNGPSMYGLVGLLSSLDDLTLDASKASRSIIFAMSQNSLKGNSPNDSPTVAVMALIESENSLYDISDLILHVTLRYAAAENDVMEELLKK
jgi:hypothetical protein